MLEVLELYRGLPPTIQIPIGVFGGTWPIIGGMLSWALFGRWKKERLLSTHGRYLPAIALGGWLSFGLLWLHLHRRSKRR